MVVHCHSRSCLSLITSTGNRAIMGKPALITTCVEWTDNWPLNSKTKDISISLKEAIRDTQWQYDLFTIQCATKRLLQKGHFAAHCVDKALFVNCAERGKTLFLSNVYLSGLKKKKKMLIVSRCYEINRMCLYGVRNVSSIEIFQVMYLRALNPRGVSTVSVEIHNT